MLSLLLIYSAAALVLLLFARIRLPAVTGFLVTGILIGPSGFGILRNPEELHTLTEAGVILLLFSVGLEMPFSLLLNQHRALTVAILQVFLTPLCFLPLAPFLPLSLMQTLYLGFAFALTSTAVCLKLLSERGELDAPHGRLATLVLIVQDLFATFLLLIPNLISPEGGGSTLKATLTRLGALLILFALFFLLRWLLPKLLNLIVRARHKELLLLVILIVCFGFGFLAQHLSLSPAVGAFLAGVLLAESPYAQAILTEVIPFRDLFMSLFFISLGALLNLEALWGELPLFLLLTLGFLAGKGVVMFAIARAFRYSTRTAVYAALTLLPAGEFSFLLLEQGRSAGFLSGSFLSLMVAVLLLSLLLIPLLLSLGEPMTRMVERISREQGRGEPPSDKEGLRHHGIVIGLGLNGELLLTLLKDLGIPVLGVDLNPELVERIRGKGIPVMYGDGTREPILEHAGIRHARFLVVAISDPVATRKIVAQARRLNPEIPILVRTRYVLETQLLKKLGAGEVVSEEVAVARQLARALLEKLGEDPSLAEELLDPLVRSRLEGETPNASPSNGKREAPG